MSKFVFPNGVFFRYCVQNCLEGPDEDDVCPLGCNFITHVKGHIKKEIQDRTQGCICEIQFGSEVHEI